MQGLESGKELLFRFKQKQKIRIPVLLDNEVGEFIKWYTDTFIKGKVSPLGEFTKPQELRNFIEKIAVWYELRYPDYEIENLFSHPGKSNLISDIMFNQNGYINEQLDDVAETRALDWADFYNPEAFFNSLSSSEKAYFAEPSYGSLLYVNPIYRHTCVYLDEEGVVTKSVNMTSYSKGAVTDEDLEGMHIRDVLKLLDSKNVVMPNNNEYESSVQYVDDCNYLKNMIFTCAMYRIIERGGRRIGPRRALLFAKEFGCNIDIPMAYGVDTSDPGLREFINEYIKAGGYTDLLCYINYFSRPKMYEPLDNITVGELLKNTKCNELSFYTDEETALHQRMVDAIAFRAHKKSRKWAKRKK